MPGTVFGCSESHDECPSRKKLHTTAPHLEICMGKTEGGCVISHEN